ncbi:hypothetical protein CBR_g34935 [Chara braunii]|uniref:BAH domain-containing protein n=1 Tax=Chara braunii TaxID=69332 RepID=A0A388LJR5_CHABU|nr:hypothetical protein CBR_g34935 [Chara braunii]|eukprot:GBG82559.1 hypothetical protein CBR_g34935 [Chara braunii]
MGDEADLPEIYWGKRNGTGGGRKRYESFKFDRREEVFLYDTVYLFPENEGDLPYVAKIMDLYDGRHDGKPAKMAKLRWFFRASDIPDDEVTRARPRVNELFLSYGDPAEVNHICPLDCVDRKCNMVCTAKHPANANLNLDDIQNADEVFYRMYDTEKEVISNDLTPLIEELGVEAVFRKSKIDIPDQNRGDGQDQPHFLNVEAQAAKTAKDKGAKEDVDHGEHRDTESAREHGVDQDGTEAQATEGGTGQDERESQGIAGGQEEPVEKISTGAGEQPVQCEEAPVADGGEGHETQAEHADSDQAGSFRSGWEDDVLRGSARIVCDDDDEVDQWDPKRDEDLQGSHGDAVDKGGFGSTECPNEAREQVELDRANAHGKDENCIPDPCRLEAACVDQGTEIKPDHDELAGRSKGKIATSVPVGQTVKKRKRDGGAEEELGNKLPSAPGKGDGKGKKGAVMKKKLKVASGNEGKEGKEGKEKGKVTTTKKAPPRKKVIDPKTPTNAEQPVEGSVRAVKCTADAPSGDARSVEPPRMPGMDQISASRVPSGDVLLVESLKRNEKVKVAGGKLPTDNVNVSDVQQGVGLDDVEGKLEVMATTLSGGLGSHEGTHSSQQEVATAKIAGYEKEAGPQHKQAGKHGTICSQMPDGQLTSGKSKPEAISRSHDAKTDVIERAIANENFPKKRSLEERAPDTNADVPADESNGFVQVSHASKKMKQGKTAQPKACEPSGDKGSMVSTTKNTGDEEHFPPGLNITLGIDVLALPALNSESGGAESTPSSAKVEHGTKAAKAQGKALQEGQMPQGTVKPVKKLQPSAVKVGKLGKKGPGHAQLGVNARKMSQQQPLASKVENATHSLVESAPGEVHLIDSKGSLPELPVLQPDACAAPDTSRMPLSLSKAAERSENAIRGLGKTVSDVPAIPPDKTSAQRTSVHSEKEQGKNITRKAGAVVKNVVKGKKRVVVMGPTTVLEKVEVDGKPQTGKVDQSQLHQKAERLAKGAAAEDSKGGEARKQEKYLTKEKGKSGSIMIIGLPCWDGEGKNLYDELDTLISHIVEDEKKASVKRCETGSGQPSLGKPASALQGLKKKVQPAGKKTAAGTSGKNSSPSGSADGEKPGGLLKKLAGGTERAEEMDMSEPSIANEQQQGLKMPLRVTDGNLAGKESNLVESPASGAMSKERFLQLKARIEGNGDKRVVLRDGRLFILKKKKKKSQTIMESINSEMRVQADGVGLASEGGDVAENKLEAKDVSSEGLRPKADTNNIAPTSVSIVKGGLKIGKADDLAENRQSQRALLLDLSARKQDTIAEAAPDAAEELKKLKKLKPKAKDWGAATTLRESREAMLALTRETTKMVPRISGRALPWAKELPIAAAQGRVLELSNIDPEMTTSDLQKLLDGCFENLRDVKIESVRVPLDVVPELTAYAIFSDAASAAQALREIEDSSLVIEKSNEPSSWRPLTGRFGIPPNRKAKDMKMRYPGHLRKTDLESAKRGLLPDKKDVLSTSHCSQPNTIEYEMGLQWKLLAEQHKLQKEILLQRHMEEIKRLMDSV